MNIKDIKTKSLETIYKRCREKRNSISDMSVALRFGWIADRCNVEMCKRIIERRHEWKN
jgi:hypothetical protein